MYIMSPVKMSLYCSKLLNLVQHWYKSYSQKMKIAFARPHNVYNIVTLMGSADSSSCSISCNASSSSFSPHVISQAVVGFVESRRAAAHSLKDI